MNRAWWICFFLIVISEISYSQDKDFGIWYGVAAEHKVAKKLRVDLAGSIRTFNKASKIEEAFIEGGLSYNLTRRLDIAGSYRLNDNLENNNSYYFQHRYQLDVKGNVPIGKLSFSGRLRFETRIKTYIKDENDDHPDYTGRIKLKAVYKTAAFPVNPYVWSETFCPMFSGKSGTIGKNRFAAGLELKITKRQSFELEYIYQRDYQPHLSDINILSLNYDIKI